MTPTLAIGTAILLIVGSLWAIPTATAWLCITIMRARAGQRDLYAGREVRWMGKS